MDFDDVSIPGFVFAIIAFFIGVIISHSMGSSLMMRLIAGLICAVAAYFIGGRIAEG